MHLRRPRYQTQSTKCDIYYCALYLRKFSGSCKICSTSRYPHLKHLLLENLVVAQLVNKLIPCYRIRNITLPYAHRFCKWNFSQGVRQIFFKLVTADMLPTRPACLFHHLTTQYDLTKAHRYEFLSVSYYYLPEGLNSFSAPCFQTTSIDRTKKRNVTYLICPHSVCKYRRTSVDSTFNGRYSDISR